jgi:hypothetical protein
MFSPSVSVVLCQFNVKEKSMNRSNLFNVLAFAGLLVAGCATPPPEHFSGYLGDYSKLESVKGEGGDEIRRWVSPKLQKGEYLKLMVDPIVFFPQAQPTPQISAETLRQIGAYANEALRRELGKSFLLVNQAGPGVARLQVAFTGVTTETEGLAPYEYIPVAAIAAGVQEATGTRSREPAIQVEAQVTDSLSNQRLAAAVRRAKAKPVLKNDKEQLTLEMMRPLIDSRAANAHEIIDRVLK